MSKYRSGRLIVVAGGGSSGHVYPVLEVVRAIHDLDPAARFAYIGQRGGVERSIIQGAELPVSLPFYGITAEKLRRYWDVRTVWLPVAVLGGAFESLQLLLQLRPAAVFCKGGYVGVPVALAAWILGVPIVLHETDAAMGLANRLIAPVAKRIAVSFAPRYLTIPQKVSTKVVYTGQPVGRAFFLVKASDRSSERPQLLITGGSQGSQSVNSLALAMLPALLARYEVTHLTGASDFARVSSALKHRHYHPIATLETTRDMAEVLAAADLVISRAGGTLFELAVLRKPAILIPLRSAANDHQRANAAILAGAGAAVVLEETTLTADELLRQISGLIRDSKQRATLTDQIAQFARPDAAAQVARLVLEVTKR